MMNPAFRRFKISTKFYRANRNLISYMWLTHYAHPNRRTQAHVSWIHVLRETRRIPSKPTSTAETHAAELIATRGSDLNGGLRERNAFAIVTKKQRPALLGHTWMHNFCVSVPLDLGGKALQRIAPRHIHDFIAWPWPILESVQIFHESKGKF